MANLEFDDLDTFPPVPRGGWPRPDFKPGQGRKVVRHIGDRLFSLSVPEPFQRLPGIGVCWTWAGACSEPDKRKGQIAWRERFGRTPKRVHRVAWMVVYGDIPEGLNVNHHCDNSLCVRPSHLYLGNQFDNMRDAARRDRMYGVLTIGQREAIYAATRGLRGSHPLFAELAAKYGVGVAHIKTISKGRFVRQQEAA